MSQAARIGILGGTLDPIHLGHLDAALAAREALRLDSVIITPAHVPPHRSRPVTSAYHRFAMAALAVNGVEGFADVRSRAFATWCHAASRRAGKPSPVTADTA